MRFELINISSDKDSTLITSPSLLNETSDDDLMQFKLEGLNVLKQPHVVWQSSNLTKKRMIFNLVFENNLKVVDGRIGTAQYSLPYRLMSNKRIPKNRLVELGGIEPPTSCVPRKRSPS